MEKAATLPDGAAYVQACRNAAESWDEALGYCLLAEDRLAELRARYSSEAYFRAKAGRGKGTKGTEGTEGGKCKHRGAVVREERCRSCCGHVQVKVYECAVHGECQLGRKLGGVRTCAGCENWRLNKVPAGVNSGMGGG
jgi:hypothetical protein